MIDLNSIYIYKSIINYNYDGDTINVDLNMGFNHVIQNVNIRLYGIDTKELRDKNPVSKALAIEAKNYVESKLPCGSTIYCKSILDKEGSFKRKLMIVYYYDENNQLKNLNLELVEKGLAELKYVDSIEELH